MGDLFDSSHLNARGFLPPLVTPKLAPYAMPVRRINSPPHRGHWRSPAPCLGQHNVEIFGGRLGLGQAELDELRTTGVM